MVRRTQEKTTSSSGMTRPLTVALLIICGAGAFWLIRNGHDLAGGGILVCLVALTAWAGYRVWEKYLKGDDFAQDLGLNAHHPSAREMASALKSVDLVDPSNQPAAEMVGEAFQLQLDLLRTALELTGAALLWPDASGATMRLRGLSTLRTDLHPGPYPLGSGIFGILEKSGGEVSLAPVGGTFTGLPYYRERGRTGGLFAIRLSMEGEIGGVLCVDRQETAPWTAVELGALRLAARRLAFDVAMSRRFLRMDRERDLFQRVSVGLRELTQGLGLDSTIDAAVKAVRTLVSSDFLALSLVQGDHYRILRAEGIHAARLLDREFPLGEGLVGQALRFDCNLPERAEYTGASPIFGTDFAPAEIRSLLILPLRIEPGNPIGALAVGTVKGGRFTRLRRELLELLAAQVAVKIDLALAHEQINQLATTDGLTGLANHRTFQQTFKNMLQRAQRQSTRLGLLLCDVDHFKRVNDTYGHPFGDTVLQAVARILAQSIRGLDLAARYGGEEFAILLESTSPDGARVTAERIRRGVEELELRHENQPVKVTLSGGLVLFPADGVEIPILIERADRALYHAKRSGRNRMVVWTPQLEQEDEDA